MAAAKSCIRVSRELIKPVSYCSLLNIASKWERKQEFALACKRSPLEAGGEIGLEDCTIIDARHVPLRRSAAIVTKRAAFPGDGVEHVEWRRAYNLEPLQLLPSWTYLASRIG